MHKDRTVFLQGESVDLVLLEQADAPLLTHWMNDKAVTQFLGRNDLPYTLQFEEDWIAKAYQDQSHLVLGIWYRADNTLIGTISLALINQINQNAELRISIGNSNYWSKGCGSDAITTLTSFAFTVKHLKTVYLHVYSHNPRGKRCYEKCGFVLGGTIPRFAYRNGVWVDQHTMYLQNHDT